ncbi:Aspartic proteinase yapsin-6 [Cytospora mali]|uniref:Aspartic proteinase yapsin-6 n=1 Tax=Cytospora mali TaxID=578113 RepID=A0A194VWU2_CYTMA|nr:Aspartic proteinase yapsin-6 [Valsa mali]
MLTSLLAVGFTLSTLTTASSSPPPQTKKQVGPSLLRSSVTTHGGRLSFGKSGRVKRQDAAGLKNQQDGTSYTIDIQIGTPPQTVTVILDTGSEELWVNPDCETSGQTDYCESFSQFDYTESSTIEDTGYSNVLAYGKGNVTIEYVTDVVSIGSASIDQQIFGVGLESYDIPSGIMGLGPPINGDDEALYSYIIDSMAIQGIIESRAFSLDLRDVDSPDGSVIFGGIDTGKYVGALEKCPMLDLDENPTGSNRYWIYLTALGMTLPSGESGLIADGELPVFLDSGGTFTRLPTQLFESIGAAFPGAQYDSDQGVFVVDCDVGDDGGSVDFGFNNKYISVPFDDFIWKVNEDDDLCVLGIMPEDEEPVLGDSFLRAAYVVYDQDNRNLHLAQAANCGSNLIAISAGEDAVPSVSGDCTATAAVGDITGTLTATQAPSTITGGISGLTSDIAPGPQGTQASTRASSSLCLTCKTSATGTASPSRTTAKANFAARETGSHLAAVGAVALAAWLV